ncbi:MAG: aminomethyl-transferring glycine dehydrogenase subunit GcvPA [Dichotomicrobium sp.]
MRLLPHSDADRAAMLSAIGVRGIDDLFADVPEAARLKDLPDLPRHASEIELERAMSRMADKNVSAGAVPFFVGCGAYKHHVPATVDHLIQRSEFMTAYTPYQPEIAQGTLQYLFEFQTQVAMLTGMDVANASMYDGSTAASEAVLMAQRVTRRPKAVISGGLHPHYRAVIETFCHFSEHDCAEAEADRLEDALDDRTACMIVQTPDVFGRIHDLRALADRVHEAGALLIVVVTEVLSLGALMPPGEMGADIVVAEGQSIGNGLNFGGPYLGLFATRQKYVRQMPGRLVGETTDEDGKRGFVLTLNTREQHIRRARATSNICTNSGLCALAFTIHMTLLGEKGLRGLAMANHRAAVALAGDLADVPGVEVLTDQFFNEFTIRVPGDGAEVVDKLADRGVLGGVPAARLWPDRPDLADRIIVAATEMTTGADRAAYKAALREVLA